jgi:DNA-binding transcriptional LysR family regulator
MFNLDELESFISIVESGSYRAASQKINKSQPVLTYHVKQLETYLGFELFDRSQYRATLTSKGKLFFPKAYALLEHAIDLESFRKISQKKVETQIALSVSSLYPSKKLSERLKHIQAVYPQTLILVSVDTLAGIEKIESGNVDIAISEVAADSIQFQSKTSMEVDMVPVHSAQHALKEYDSISEKALLQYPQIVLKSSGTQSVEDRGVVQMAKHWIVSDMSMKKQLIVDGFGWGYLPRHLIEAELDNGELCVLECESMPVRSVCLHSLRRHSEKMGPVEAAIWELF